MDAFLSFRWLELTSAPLLLLGTGGTQVLQANRAFQQLAGPSCPALPSPLASLLGAAADRALRAMVGESGPGQFAASLTTECQIGGRQRRLTLHVSALPAPDDHWLITVLEAQATATAETSWQHDLEAILGWLPIGLEVLDENLSTVYANSYISQLFGYSGEEVRYLEDWLRRAFPDPDYRARVIRDWEQALAELQANRREFVAHEWDVTCKDGSHKAIEYRYRPLQGGSVGVYHDISRERRLQAELRTLADTDALTGLYNRRFFLEAAATEVERSRVDDAPLALLFLDFDHFKQINDRHGHAAGDLVLRVAAERFQQVLRHDDLIARLGGEEFGVLLKETPEPTAWQIAERLRAAIAAAPIQVGDRHLPLTVSIGGATGGGGLEALIERADRAVYEAKNAGRDCIRFAPEAKRS